MSLVAYDNSDSSDYEDEVSNVEDAPVKPIIVNNNTHFLPKSPISDDETEDQKEDSNIFNLLPQPSKKITVVAEEDDEFLHKKAEVVNIPKPRAKISVPSLSDFKDVEGSVTSAKPKNASGKKSGLLSMLPQPRNFMKSTTKSLIPHVLTTKTNNATKKLPTPSSVAKKNTETKTLIANYSDDSDNDEIETDFFSINKPEEPIIDLPVEDPLVAPTNSNEPVNKQPRTLESYFKKTDDLEITESPMEDQATVTESYEIPESTSTEAVLDEEAIMKLCGTRGKRKREEIQILDINQQDVLAEAREMLRRGLMEDTSKRVSASKRRGAGNDITSQQKRKHQITYLAHQAKANEAELQNQWANNRMSKRQTQSKYGF